ncbi:MAG: hypothetical protein AB7G25_05540 [Sphingomonadaceae bacterium]
MFSGDVLTKLALALLALHATGCEISAEPRDDMAEAARLQAIDGYGGIKLGSTFNEVLAITGSSLFNRVGLGDCVNDLPLKGCILTENMQNTPFDIKDGIPYTLVLDFNKRDQLTDISLHYDRAGGITAEQCMEIHERTLDWLTPIYGRLHIGPSNNKSDVETRRTAKGNVYRVGKSAGFLITTAMRTARAPIPANAGEMPISKWNGERYLWLGSRFIVLSGQPMCSVRAQFSEPDSVERRLSSR